MTEDPRDDFDFIDDILDEDGDELGRPDPVTVPEMLESLANIEESGILPAGVVYSLADLDGSDFDAFMAGWAQIPANKRVRTVRTLGELCESNYDLSYEHLAYAFFEDENAEVRANAIDLLWFDTTERLFYRLMRMADEPSPIVRAAALSALGRFIYEAEMEEFNLALADKARDYAIDRFYDYMEDINVRRRALEAVSQGTHEAVNDMIKEAYDSPEKDMQVSAVFAMGASCDDKWSKPVLIELDSESPEMRFEAARAAGSLALEEAVPMLIHLANEPDYEVKVQSILALGEIGTNEAKRALSNIAEAASEAEDEDLVELAEEALELASLMGGLTLPMFDFDDDEFDDIYGEDFDDDL